VASTGRKMATPYPYTRSEECSWQPEEVARHLAALATLNAPSISTDTFTTAQLLTHGWSSRQVSTLRFQFGANQMQGDKDEKLTGIRRYAPWMAPVLEALASQLKEPLILMLLGSAGISIFLGNTADAVSIAIALLIVSMVAAVQEYRSEQALEKLSSLVPHTCTVLRDGRVFEGFLARNLVVGDLILLSQGNRVPADCRVVDSVELLAVRWFCV
jgi:magnesium-transporting ATPase (P-type)